MIILIINQNRILTFKRKCQTPVTADIDRPMSGKIAMRLVKPPARSVHVFRRFCVIKGKELPPKPLRMFWLNTCLRPMPEKSLNAFMSKAFYHQSKCIALLYRRSRLVLWACLIAVRSGCGVPATLARILCQSRSLTRPMKDSRRRLRRRQKKPRCRPHRAGYGDIVGATTARRASPHCDVAEPNNTSFR